MAVKLYISTHTHINLQCQISLCGHNLLNSSPVVTCKASRILNVACATNVTGLHILGQETARQPVLKCCKMASFMCSVKFNLQS